jgi:hypothetical protein
MSEYHEQLQAAREQVQNAAEHHQRAQAAAAEALAEYQAKLLALSKLVTEGTSDMRPAGSEQR